MFWFRKEKQQREISHRAVFICTSNSYKIGHKAHLKLSVHGQKGQELPDLFSIFPLGRASGGYVKTLIHA